MAVKPLGTEANPLTVAIVGSGPSGFYAAEALLKQALSIRVDMYERLPAPFGLVRHGVAPDHPKLKQAIQVYEKVAQSVGFHLFGNLAIGKDIAVDELRAAYHAVIFTCGAEGERSMGIHGEDLPGSHTATEFVGWYNGHPDYRDRQFDLSAEVAVIVGQGNVAIDVARILSKTSDELQHTDIAEHALAALAKSRVKDVYIVGRRGPVQARFTHIELRELGELADCEPVVTAEDLILNDASETELEDKSSRTNLKNMETLAGFAERGTGDKSRRVHVKFLLNPIRLEGDGRVERIVFEKNELQGQAFSQQGKSTGETVSVECGLVFRSIGYKGLPMPGLPFDKKRGVLPNVEGRIVDDQLNPIPGLYAAGWIKRGPTGIIGTNRADSVATVKLLLDDLKQFDQGAKQGSVRIRASAESKGIRIIAFDDWLKIDQAEVAHGEPKGKPREKFTRVDEMLNLLKS